MTQDPSFARELTEFSPHSDIVTEAAWSPSGQYLCSIGRDKKVLIHQIATGSVCHTYSPTFPLMHVAFVNDDCLLLCDFKASLRLYNWSSRALAPAVSLNAERAYAMRYSFVSSTVALGYQSGSVEFAVIENNKINPIPRILNVVGSIWQLEWSKSGEHLYVSSNRNGVSVFNVKNMTQLENFPGNGAFAVSEDRGLIAVFQRDLSIRVWGLDSRRLALLEGNTEKVGKLTFTSDGNYLISKSVSGKCLAWETEKWRLVSEWNETVIYPHFPLICSPVAATQILTTGSMQKSVVLRKLKDQPMGAGLSGNPQYKNAKIVLMGESGVGKSALAHQLLGHGWRLTESTHGRQIDRLYRNHDCGELREVYLWDLAGQPNYRLTHQLHLDEVSVALVMFDDRAERDPFVTPRYWHRALSTATFSTVEGNDGPAKILVAGRTDRGNPLISNNTIDAFISEHGFSGFKRTSARTGAGVEDLRNASLDLIKWDRLPSISSTHLFQEVQELILGLKAQGVIIQSVGDSYRALLGQPHANRPKETEFRTCMGLLESRGLIRRLPVNDLVLFSPEFLDAYASAIVNETRTDPKGLGSIKESDVLSGRLSLPTADRISDTETERLLIIATLEDIIKRQLAYRENTADGTIIVFPSQFLHDKPDLALPNGIDVRIRFRGPLQNIFSILTVRLFYAPGPLALKEIWRNGIVLRDEGGRRAGIQISDFTDGEGEIAVFFDENIGGKIRENFTDLVRQNVFAYAQHGSVRIDTTARCLNGNCRTEFTREQMERRRGLGFLDIRCSVCDTENPISIESKSPDSSQLRSTADAIEKAHSASEMEASLAVGVGLIEMKETQSWLMSGTSEPHLVVAFTDIVESTSIANEVGDLEMDILREKHFSRLSKLLSEYDGRIIKTMGDGALVVFRSSVKAVQFSIQALKNTGDKKIKIRIGLHIGRVTPKGDDISGRTVNYASRIQGVLPRGGVAMSVEIKADLERILGRHNLQNYIKFLIHERVQLKGFEGFQTLWQVKNCTPRFPEMRFDNLNQGIWRK